MIRSDTTAALHLAISGVKTSNKLEIAYRDLLIQNLLRRYKFQQGVGYNHLIETFFDDFQQTRSDLLSLTRWLSRLSTVNREGFARRRATLRIVASVGTFRDGSGGIRCGVVVSNLAFQAGAFDMASAEKFIKLLVDAPSSICP